MQRGDGPEDAQVHQVEERLGGLELAEPGTVGDALHRGARQGELVDPPLVPAEGRRLAVAGAPPLGAGRGRVELLQPFEGHGGRGDLPPDEGPLVDDPVALHEHRFAAKRRDGLAVEGDLARLERVGAALPVEELVDGLGGLQRGHLPQLLLRDHPELHHDVAEPAQGALLHPERLLELLLGDQVGADEQAAQLVPGLPAGVFRAHHRAVPHHHVDLVGAGLEVQHPALRLLADELEDLRDPEILEGAGQRHGLTPAGCGGRCRAPRSRTGARRAGRPRRGEAPRRRGSAAAAGSRRARTRPGTPGR